MELAIAVGDRDRGCVRAMYQHLDRAAKMGRGKANERNNTKGKDTRGNIDKMGKRHTEKQWT